MPLDICGIVLGSPYLCDRRAIFHFHQNKYHLFKNGIKYIVRAHNNKMILSLMNVGQMKRIVNASHNFALLMFKHRDVDEPKAFQGYESSLKYDFIEASNSSDKMFQESNVFLPKIGQQNEVQLQHNASLLSIGVNNMLVLMHVEVKNKMIGKFDKEKIGPKTYSFGFHNVFDLKRYSAC